MTVPDGVTCAAGRKPGMTDEAASRGYRIVKPLGQGRDGAVFIAEKVTTHQTYAMKFLKEDFARDPTYLSRFERENPVAAAIRHPHVVNVFDWWFPAAGEAGSRSW